MGPSPTQAPGTLSFTSKRTRPTVSISAAGNPPPSLGPNPTTTMVQLPPFTCLGVTTLSGLVSDPLRSRFVQCLTLEPCSDAELQTIVMDAAGKMGFRIAKTIAMEVAKRSRATARTAIANLRWLAEFCEGTGSSPDAASIKEAFELKEISPDGLT